MTHIKSILCLTVFASLIGFNAGAADDAKAINGTWKPVKAELAGQPFPDAILKTISLKLHEHPKTPRPPTRRENFSAANNA